MLNPITLTMLLFLAKFNSGNSVNRSKFKTCDQSGFCKRLKQLSEDTNRFETANDTIYCHKGHIQAVLTDKNFQNKLLVHIESLTQSRLRIKITEVVPKFKRPDIFKDFWEDIQSEPEHDTNSKTEYLPLENMCKLDLGSLNILHVHFDRFRIYLKNTRMETIFALNERGLTYMEPHLNSDKKRNENTPNLSNVSDSEFPVSEEAESTQDFHASETFDGFTDTLPQGHKAISFDSTFYGYSYVYGIPEHADTFPLNTESKEPYRLYNLDVFEYELYNHMALYGSVPILIAHNDQQTLGLLHLNAAETWVYLEKSQRTFFDKLMGFKEKEIPRISNQWISESGIIDLIIMLGPNPSNLGLQLSKTVGFQQLPPMFSVGFHQCRWNYNTQEDVELVHRNFDKANIPLDVIWLDIEHTDDKKYFTFESRKFSDPVGMQKNLSDSGRKMVTIVDPHVKKQDSYYIYNEAKDSDYLVKDHNGNQYTGWCWPGHSVYPDYIREEVRDWWSSQFHSDKYKFTTNDLYTWVDMNEPSVFNGPEITLPKDALHGEWEHRDVHNLYAEMCQVATFNGGLFKTNNKLRPFVLSRGFFAGSQKYGAVWTGDNSAEWSHLKISVPMLLSLSIAGIHFCGADVGGFFKIPSSQLAVRWYQAGSVSPFFRAHAHIDTPRREAYLYDEDTLANIKEAIQGRYRYLPYWYSVFYESSSTGNPIMRPLWHDFYKDVKTYPIEDSYMIGNSLLVKPIVEQDVFETLVYFPLHHERPNLWFDLTDNKVYEGGVRQVVHAPLKKIPMFQRSSTIVPTWQRHRRATSKLADDPITLLIALDKLQNASGVLYLDDGLTTDHQNGIFSIVSFTFENGILLGQVQGTYETKIWLERVVISGLTTPVNLAYVKDSSGEREIKVYLDSLNRHVIRRPGSNLSNSFQIRIY